MDKTESLDQHDYQYLTLMAMGDLMEKSEKVDFSVDEISKNLVNGKSKNRVLYSLVELISDGYVRSSDNDFEYSDVDKDLDDLKTAMDHDYYLTIDGVSKYDSYIKTKTIQEKFRNEEISLDLEILVFVYKKMKSFLFSYPRVLDSKMNTDQIEALNSLLERGLISSTRRKSQFRITGEGKRYLEDEAKLRDLDLEKYISARDKFSDFLQS